MGLTVRLVNEAIQAPVAKRDLFENARTRDQVAEVVSSPDFTISTDALSLPIDWGYWDTPYTRALINRDDFAESCDPVAFAQYIDAAAENPDSETTRALILSPNKKLQAKIKTVMLSSWYPIELRHVDLAVSNEGRYLNSIYSCALFQRGELKDICGHDLFSAICKKGFEMRNRFISMGIARNKDFPVSREAYDLCVREYNSFFARGYVGNPSRKIEDADYDTARRLRAQNGNQETMFEQGLKEHPQFDPAKLT